MSSKNSIEIKSNILYTNNVSKQTRGKQKCQT